RGNQTKVPVTGDLARVVLERPDVADRCYGRRRRTGWTVGGLRGSRGGGGGRGRCTPLWPGRRPGGLRRRGRRRGGAAGTAFVVETVPKGALCQVYGLLARTV